MKINNIKFKTLWTKIVSESRKAMKKITWQLNLGTVRGELRDELNSCFNDLLHRRESSSQKPSKMFSLLIPERH